MFKNQKLILFFLILGIFKVSAQSKVPCGTPTIESSNKNWQKDENKLKNFLLTNKNSRNFDSLITIPIVVHVLWNLPAENISDAQVLNQIASLNLDFKLKNADTTNIPSPFKIYAGNPNIEFCLAQRTPEGLPTNGIIHKHTDSTFIMMQSKEKFDMWGGSNAWDINRYLNIWICNVQGVYGYAVFPSSNLMANYGITLNYAGATYGGRCIDHELGHAFNLRHIWGDTYCGDDSVADTPIHLYSNNGCPLFPYIPWNSTCATSADGEMFMNYMDYTSDVCKNMFTKGQVDRMRASILTFCPGLIFSDVCQPVNLFSKDAGVHAIRNIFERSCTGLISPFVTFRNWGTDTLTSIKIFYQIDGNIPDSIVWSGTLASLDTFSMAMPSISVMTGNHIFKVYTKSPNNSPDANPANDTSICRFNIYQTGNLLPYFEGFEGSIFPPAETSAPNPDGTYTWEKTTALGCSGSFCMLKDNYSPGLEYPNNTYFGYLQKDEFILPNLDLNSAVAPTMTFRLAYTESNYWDPNIIISDTLEILLSTDCGNTYNLLYEKTDSALWTTPSTMPAQPYSPLSTSEWRKDTVDISDYEISTNAIIKFVDKSFVFGNRLFIDDINIAGSTGITEVKQNEVKIYPNPSSGIFNVEFEKNPENYLIEIFDVFGRSLLFSNERANFNKTTINLFFPGDGVYIVKISSKKETQYFKLIIKKKD